MNENVYFFMGVNGVGKTTLLKEVKHHFDDAEHVRAVDILMKLFNGISRDELEKLTPQDKFARMEPAFIQLFNNYQCLSRVLFDTHLVVVIRKNDIVKTENIWSSSYLPYINHAFFVTADPEVISQRRILDFETTGRRRDPNVQNITFDQYSNYEEFQRSVQPYVRSTVVDNTGDFDTQVRTIISRIQ